MIKTEDFGVLVRVRNERSFCVHGSPFNAVCMVTEEPSRLRVGLTVGKKNSPRSVDRALIKRVLREAVRNQAPELVALLRERGLGLDVSIRLREPLKSVPAVEMGATALKRDLRVSADELVRGVRRRVLKLATRTA